VFLALEFTATPEQAAERWTLTRARAFILAAVDLCGLTAIHQVGGDYAGDIKLMQLIAESHIAVHLTKSAPEPHGTIHIFSCRDFDQDAMANLAAQFFVPMGGTVLTYTLPRGHLPELPDGTN
jgi:S-adenosylmethionine/arginine decarboxylase-like enzyme